MQSFISLFLSVAQCRVHLNNILDFYQRFQQHRRYIHSWSFFCCRQLYKPLLFAISMEVLMHQVVYHNSLSNNDFFASPVLQSEILLKDRGDALCNIHTPRPVLSTFGRPFQEWNCFGCNMSSCAARNLQKPVLHMAIYYWPEATIPSSPGYWYPWRAWLLLRKRILDLISFLNLTQRLHISK